MEKDVLERGRQRAPGGPPRPPLRRDESRLRLLARRAAQRIAVVAALLILFYATSIHGISLRTFILAGVLILSLYWMFKGLW